MNTLVQSIQSILNSPFQRVEGTADEILDQLMPHSAKSSLYAMDGERLIGLNLSNIGLTDAQWQQIQALIEPGDLRGLNLSDNLLSAFHLSAEYGALEQLNVSDNPGLKTLTFEKALPQLRELNAGWCQLKSLRLPAGFSALQLLKLSHNKLEAVAMEGDCNALKRIDLNNNNLPEFYLPEGSVFESLEAVYLQKNPLAPTLEASVKEGPAALARFLRQLALQGITESYEIKLLIVGEGESGKTTLWKFLQDNTHQPEAKQVSTIGIGIREGLTFEHPDRPNVPFSVNLWDFGGQEIQYMTHQFFLTRRSFYVLLADGRREVANFPYWLKVINLLGTDPNTAEKLAVLVVLNEKGNPIAKMPYDPATVITDFPRLEVLKYEVDFGKRDARLHSLPDFIREILGRRFPHLPLKVPKKWGAVRSALQHRRNEEKQNHITAAEFAEICRSKGIADPQQQDDLSRMLHDLGIVLHYQEVLQLHDFVILNPEWAVNAVYELLRHPEVKDTNQGRFDLDLLGRVWSGCGYTKKEQQSLLNLMLKDGFEVCFEAKEVGKKIYIAPQLLPEFQPALDWEASAVVLRFLYQYAFMPKGIIGRLIVRLHTHLESRDEQKVIWEKGMILAKNDCRALVREVTDSAETGLNQIRIEISGQHREDCKYLLREICEQLDDIHRDSFPALKIDKQVPCICAVCLQSTAPHFYNLAELEERKASDKKTIECKFKPFEAVSIEGLLSGVLSHEKTLMEPDKNTPKKVFFSYSKKDKTLLDELLIQLAPLRRSGKVEPWHDRDLKPGEEWDQAICDKLAEAYVIVLLVSPDFLATDYIWEVEIKEAMERHERREARVIPILLRPSDWTNMPFSKLNMLPHKAKPVTQYDDRDTAWQEVVEAIKTIL